MWDSLCWLARREGFAVEREDGRPEDGAALWAARRIRILPGLTSGQAIWALAHQLGHVLLRNTIAHSPGTTTFGCQGKRKAEEDSVAFIVCARHGASAQEERSTEPLALPIRGRFPLDSALPGRLVQPPCSRPSSPPMTPGRSRHHKGSAS